MPKHSTDCYRHNRGKIAPGVDKGSIGECVYIRTHTSSNTADDADADIYRIKICDAEQ